MDLFTCCDNRNKLCYMAQTAYAARTHANCSIRDLYWNSAGFIFKQKVILIVFN